MVNLNLLINTESFLNEVNKHSFYSPDKDGVNEVSLDCTKDMVISISDLSKIIYSMLIKQDSDNTTRPKSYVCTMCDGKKEVLNGDPMNGMEICPTCEGQGHFLCFPRTTRE